jgi:predicted acetyltransferase
MRGYASFTHSKTPAGKTVIEVDDFAYDSVESFKRFLHLFASLKDQYSAVTIQLPVDLALNHLLKESHVPYRPVSHDTAETRLYTRMQVRVLDHVKLLQSMHRLPAETRGGVTVAIHETEGDVTKLRIDLEAGRAAAKLTTARPDVECADKDWASIVTGYMPASQAAHLGIISATNPKALEVLDAFTQGPAPFCTEYF